jgi:hypothetical protein
VEDGISDIDSEFAVHESGNLAAELIFMGLMNSRLTQRTPLHRRSFQGYG